MSTIFTLMLVIPMLCYAVAWWIKVGRWFMKNGRDVKDKVQRVRDAAMDAIK
jgi:hypothetical protein